MSSAPAPRPGAKDPFKLPAGLLTQGADAILALIEEEKAQAAAAVRAELRPIDAHIENSLTQAHARIAALEAELHSTRQSAERMEQALLALGIPTGESCLTLLKACWEVEKQVAKERQFSETESSNPVILLGALRSRLDKRARSNEEPMSVGPQRPPQSLESETSWPQRRSLVDQLVAARQETLTGRKGEHST